MYAVARPGVRTHRGALAAGARAALASFVFDLLFLDGEDPSRRPLLERTAVLEGLLGQGRGVLRHARHPPSPRPREGATQSE